MNILSIWKSTNGQLCQRLFVYIQENVDEIIRLSKQLHHLASGRKLDLAELLIQPKPVSVSLNDDELLDANKEDQSAFCQSIDIDLLTSKSKGKCLDFKFTSL
ncbi:unnamed protein product [Trichobilharzia regenti]|nr:unnamed protein product [Trichobilharzia regenti]